MDYNIFDYLLVTKQSMDNCDIITRDYKTMTEKFKEINKLNKTNYSCHIVGLNLSWKQRIRLSCQTGIPLIKIKNINRICKFSLIILTDCMKDNSFFGRIKIYDSPDNIPRIHIIEQVDVTYTH